MRTLGGDSIKRVAAYCRVSTDKRDQANSFESQQQYFRERISHEPDWELQEIYADEGLSGTSMKKRTQFNRMLQAAREGNVDLIITKEVSRFARNTVDTLCCTRELRRLGVGVIFLLDNIDTREADGELRLTLMASIAQEESNRTSSRVRWGQTEQMKRGVVFGRSLLGYDVRDGRITINPNGAALVRRIFYKYLNEHKGTCIIARELREEGARSSRDSVCWSASTVLKILKNEKYCGDLIQKKTYTPDFLTHEKRYNRGQVEKIVLRDHHEPIIDRATWDAVQCELARRRTGNCYTNGHGNRHPLSGKVRCGECGSCFVARIKTRKDGTQYRRWRCGKAVAAGRDADGGGCCIGRQLREDTALELIRQSVCAVEFDRQHMAEELFALIDSVLRADRDETDVIERELARISQRRRRALDALLDGVLGSADYQEVFASLDREAALLTQRLDSARKQQGICLQHSGRLAEIVAGVGNDEVFLASLLDYITVYSDGRVEVVLKGVPARWVYAVDGISEYQELCGCQSDSSVPISVNNPLSSG